jgi:hypothetical protein
MGDFFRLGTGQKCKSRRPDASKSDPGSVCFSHIGGTVEPHDNVGILCRAPGHSCLHRAVTVWGPGGNLAATACLGPEDIRPSDSSWSALASPFLQFVSLFARRSSRYCGLAGPAFRFVLVCIAFPFSSWSQASCPPSLPWALNQQGIDHAATIFLHGHDRARKGKAGTSLAKGPVPACEPPVALVISTPR